MGIKDTLLQFMQEDAYKPMDLSELTAVFDIKSNEYKAFKKVLKTMEREGLIVRNQKEKYSTPERSGLITGRLQGHPRGFGFLISEVEGEKDVFISASSMNSALNGDRVLV